MKVLRVIVDEMPKNCRCCIYASGLAFHCNAFSDWREITRPVKPSWCPLEVETDGWIPLPELPNWVIGVDNRGEVYPCVYEDGRWLNDVQDALPTGCVITQWRPLPEAPKKVKE